MKQNTNVLLLILLLAHPVSAHELYLVPDQFLPQKQQTTKILMFLEKDGLVWFASETAGMKEMLPSGGMDILNLPDENPMNHPSCRRLSKSERSGGKSRKIG